MKNLTRTLLGVILTPLFLGASESQPPSASSGNGSPGDPNAYIQRVLEEAGKLRPDQRYSTSDPLECAVSLARLTDPRDENRNDLILLWVDALLSRDDVTTIRRFLKTYPDHHPVRGIILARLAHWHAAAGLPAECHALFEKAKEQLPYASTSDRVELFIELAATLEAAEEPDSSDEFAAALDLENRTVDIRWNSRKALERAHLGKEHMLYARSEHRENHMDPDWIPNASAKLEIAALAFDRDEASSREEKLNRLRQEVKDALAVTKIATSVEMSPALRALEILRTRGEAEYHAQLLEDAIPYVRIKPLTFSQKGTWTAALVRELALAGRDTENDQLLEALKRQSGTLMPVLQAEMNLIQSTCLRIAGKPAVVIEASDNLFEEILNGLVNDDHRKNLLLKFCLLLYEHDLEVGPEKLKTWFQTATH